MRQRRRVVIAGSPALFQLRRSNMALPDLIEIVPLDKPVRAEIIGAKNDGQATGMAMKHLKQKGLAVLGEDVAAAVRQLRAG